MDYCLAELSSAEGYWPRLDKSRPVAEEVTSRAC